MGVDSSNPAEVIGRGGWERVVGLWQRPQRRTFTMTLGDQVHPPPHESNEEELRKGNGELRYI